MNGIVPLGFIIFCFMISLCCIGMAIYNKTHWRTSFNKKDIDKENRLYKWIAFISMLIAVGYPAIQYNLYEDLDHFELKPTIVIPDNNEFAPIVFNEKGEKLTYLKDRLCYHILSKQFPERKWNCTILDFNDYENTPTGVLIDKTIKFPQDLVILRADISCGIFPGACRMDICRIEQDKKTETWRSTGHWMEGEFRSWFEKLK